MEVHRGSGGEVVVGNESSRSCPCEAGLVRMKSVCANASERKKNLVNSWPKLGHHCSGRRRTDYDASC